MESGITQERPWHRWLATGLVALAAGLRSYQLDQNGLSGQELPSLLACAAEDGGLYQDYTGATGYPPGFPLIFCRYVAVLGESELAARSFSVLAGVMLVWLAYHIGRRVFSPAAGLLAAVIVATDHQGIIIDRSAQMYSLLTLCTVLAGYCFCSLLSAPPRSALLHCQTAHADLRWSWSPPCACDGRYLLAFWLTSVLAFYISTMTVVLYAAVAIVASGLLREHRDLRNTLLSPLLLAALPWLPALWGYHEWASQGHLIGEPSWLTLQSRLLALVSPMPVAQGSQIVLLGAAVILLPVGAATRRYSIRQQHWFIWTGALSLVTLLVLALVEPASTESCRAMVFCITIAVAGTVSEALRFIRVPSLSAGILACMLMLVGYTQLFRRADQPMYLSGQQEDFRGLADIVAGDAGFRDAHGILYLADPRFSYYLKRHGFPAALIVDARRTPPPERPFYYLEFFGGDPARAGQAAPGLPGDAYKPACRTVLRWMRLTKYTTGSGVELSDTPPDCRIGVNGDTT